MATVSLLQRFVEGAFDVALTTSRNFAGSATTRIDRGESWARRGRGLASSFDFHNTRNAANEYFGDRVKDSINILNDPNRSLLRKGAEVGLMGPRAVIGGLHTGVAAATDVIGGAGAVAGSIAGHAISAPVQLAAATMAVGKPVAKATLKGGWALAKGTGMTPTGIAKGVGMAGGELAKDVGGTVAGAGKLLWNTRKDPLMGTALVGGAIVVGAAMGAGEYNDEQIYGSAYGGRGTGKAYMNPQIQSPAWQLNPTPSPGMDRVQANMQKSAEEDNALVGGIDPLYGPLGHDFGHGATGDLVFALHNLRSGGQI